LLVDPPVVDVPLVDELPVVVVPLVDVVPPVVVVLLVVEVLFPANAFAAAWNMSKVLAGVGLTAKTIPDWQWGRAGAGGTCLQKNQRGADALFTVIDHWGRLVDPAGTLTKPESAPPGTGVHGSVKVDCVTEWFFAWNWKEIVSPAAAVS